MADRKLSALTELAETPADDDEVYIRDISESASLESKRITIANLLAGGVSDPHGAAQHTDVTRELFIPANEGRIDEGTAGEVGQYGVVTGATDAELGVEFTIKVPDDFVSYISLKAVWGAYVAAGNMYWHLTADWAASGESFTNHSEDGVIGTTATAGSANLNVQEPSDPLALATLNLGDYLGVKFYRNGTHEDDTMDTVVYFLGLLLTYVASQ